MEIRVPINEGKGTDNGNKGPDNRRWIDGANSGANNGGRYDPDGAAALTRPRATSIKCAPPLQTCCAQSAETSGSFQKLPDVSGNFRLRLTQTSACGSGCCVRMYRCADRRKVVAVRSQMWM